jgi:AbrB family looped-hinge helix DNA binding protein
MTVAIVTLGTKGQLVIPSEMRVQLDIKPGTRISVSLEGGRIILQPASDQLVDESMGILKGGPSMTEELLKERRSERW